MNQFHRFGEFYKNVFCASALNNFFLHKTNPSIREVNKAFFR